MSSILDAPSPWANAPHNVRKVHMKTKLLRLCVLLGGIAAVAGNGGSPWGH